jgi:murein DD-endopeptidase MepM/ murein hydrolase activator NlpD
MNRVFSEYKWWILGGGGTAGLAFAVALVMSGPSEDVSSSPSAPITVELDEDIYREDISTPPLVIENETLEDIVEAEAEPEPEPDIVELSAVFTRGNNGLADFLRPYDVPYVEVLSIDRAIDAIERAGFKVDDPIELRFMDGQLDRFTWFKDALTKIVVHRHEDGDFVAVNEAPTPTQQRFLIDTEIDSSFYMSLKEDGMADEIILEMARVLGFSLDFRYDIHQGNRIRGSVTCDFYEASAYFPDGLVTNCNTNYAHARIGYGSGDTVEIFEHFIDGEEDSVYLDPDGRSAANTILRVPINGARLSSNFGGRRHPVLGTWRNHNGTDFAAPTGTPIYAAGDGIVERANRYGSFGNYVRIRHSGGYKTAYAHMSRFGGFSEGERVRQGEVIGYVGTTGRSTGPHLHYEVYLDGRPINSQTMAMPKVAYLEGEALDQFQQDIEGIRGEFAIALARQGVNDFVSLTFPALPEINLFSLPRSVSLSRQLRPE